MVSIELDKPRTLKYDLAALRDLEAAMAGKPLLEILRDILNLGITATVAALYHGLKHEDRGLNQTLVMRMLEKHIKDGGKLRPVATAIDEALGETGMFGEKEGNAQPEPAAQT